MPWKEADVVELRIEAVIRRLRGERVSDLSKEFGVQPKTIHKWMGRYREEGHVVCLTDHGALATVRNGSAKRLNERSSSYA